MLNIWNNEYLVLRELKGRIWFVKCVICTVGWSVFLPREDQVPLTRPNVYTLEDNHPDMM